MICTPLHVTAKINITPRQKFYNINISKNKL